MSALEDAVKHIEYSADSETDRKWATDARAELAALNAVIEAARKVPADIYRMMMLIGGSMDERENVERLAAALAKYDEVTK